MRHGTQSATFSLCGTYRYDLTRIWDSTKPLVNFIGLNPSTANAEENDATISKCMGYAGRWKQANGEGYGGIVMTNLFAFRATDPGDMIGYKSDKIGPENDFYVQKWHKTAGITVIAWGENGIHENRCETVLQYLGDVYCLTKLGNGQPGHPLYKRADLQPINYTY